MQWMRPVWLAMVGVMTLGTLFVAAGQTQFEFRYKCGSGRFTKTSNLGKTKHYCFDGKYYDNRTVPADVKAYFEQMAREHQAAMAEHERKLSEARALREQHRQEAESRRTTSGRASRAGAPLAARGRTTGVVEASAKPEAEPLAPAALKAVAVGTPAVEVIDAIGEPPGKVATGEGAETWTYVLTSGAFAKVRMEADRVKSIELP